MRVDYGSRRESNVFLTQPRTVSFELRTSKKPVGCTLCATPTGLFVRGLDLEINHTVNNSSSRLPSRLVKRPSYSSSGRMASGVSSVDSAASLSGTSPLRA